MPRRIKNTVIEFVGLPGSGKSTITLGLISLLTRKKISVDNYLDYHNRLIGSKIGKLNFILFILFNPIRIYGLISSLRRDIPLNRYSKSRIVKLLILIFAIKRYCRQNPKEVLILDQGLVQMIASIYIPHFSSENRQIDLVIKKTFNLLPIDINYQIIRVNTAVDRAKERIHSREKKTCEFKNLSEGELVKILNIYHLFFEKVPCHFSISSDDMVDVNVNFIYDYLLSR